jgi:hypothetical protein
MMIIFLLLRDLSLTDTDDQKNLIVFEYYDYVFIHHYTPNPHVLTGAKKSSTERTNEKQETLSDQISLNRNG